MYRRVCVHMYRFDVNINFPSHSLSVLYIEAGSPAEPGVPFPISSSHILGFIHGHQLTWIFMWILGSELWSSQLHSKLFTC